MAHEPIEVLLIGGRSGVGKTTVSHAVSDRLRELDIAHALVDGDNLDAVYPKPERADPTWINLAAIWRTYRALSHHRLIYVNTVSVLEDRNIRLALAGEAKFTGILLTGTDTTASERLARREIGGALDAHLERSAAASAHLERAAPAWVHRVSTDGRSVQRIVEEIIPLTGWASPDQEA